MPVYYLKEPDSIFIHNPKTGGSTIKGYVWPDNEKYLQGFIPQEYNNKFKFAFVRNPYDRFISAWRFCIATARFKTSFLDNPQLFFKLVYTNTKPYIWPHSNIYDANGKYYQTWARHHAGPQSDPFYMVERADFIGRFENFQEDLNKVCDIVGIKRIITLPKINSTEHLHYSEYFKDKEFAERVAEYYKEDFERFGYETLL